MSQRRLVQTRQSSGPVVDGGGAVLLKVFSVLLHGGLDGGGGVGGAHIS